MNPENYRSIAISKSLYKGPSGSLTRQLELLDPSEAYAGTELANLDAYQRQLKRFDIRVSGEGSSPIEKFFSTADSAALFPEYVSRAVQAGIEETDVINAIIASRTKVSSLDYRSITADFSAASTADMAVDEGDTIPTCEIVVGSRLVTLTKRGRVLSASYEALRFQKLDLFTVALRKIGAYIAKSQLADAVDVLLHGGGSDAEEIKTAGDLTYAHLISLWEKFSDFQMNTLLVAPDMAAKILTMQEFRDPAAGLQFQATGKLGTPLGAVMIKSSAVPAGKVIALDRRYALEMAVASEVSVDYDKLIDTQLERAAITSIAGFAKIFPDAVKVLSLTAAAGA